MNASFAKPFPKKPFPDVTPPNPCAAAREEAAQEGEVTPGTRFRRMVMIMAGGKGERFWPMSREDKPKHLLPIVGDAPMITQTVNRLGGLVAPSDVCVITRRDQRVAIAEACPFLPVENIIGEPAGRDTAAVVALCSLVAGLRAGGDPVSLAILPADAAIEDEEAFRKTLRTAFEFAESREALVTLGVMPVRPATGYGYIKRGERVADFGAPAFKVMRFVEKPDLATAKTYLAEGDYYWNAGMFVWRLDTVREAFARHAPDIASALDVAAHYIVEGEPFDKALAEVYPTLRKISIDYALMEKASNVYCIPACFGWDDVGEWTALARHLPADAEGNVLKGDAVLVESRDNIVVAESGHLLALLGVEGLVVVRAGSATLVCHQSRAQDIKRLLSAIRTRPDLTHLT